MNRTERLHGIVEELRVAGPRGRTSAWLAERFEVSSRTIKRDVSALQRVGVALYAEEGRGGGYRLARSATLPPLAFTAGEATALAVAVAAEPGLPFGPDGRTALAKIVGAMEPGQRAAASRLARRIWMRTPGGAPRPPVTRIVDQALRESVVVSIDYEDTQGRTTRRRAVEPVAMARTNGHWYLLAWCRRASGPRWFRLDRIRGARPTTEPIGSHDPTELFGPPPPDAQPVVIDEGGPGGSVAERPTTRPGRPT